MGDPGMERTRMNHVVPHGLDWDEWNGIKVGCFVEGWGGVGFGWRWDALRCGGVGLDWNGGRCVAIGCVAIGWECFWAFSWIHISQH